LEHLSRSDFEEAVAEALESLPERFARLVENVAISMEEEPAPRDLAGDRGTELLGIYRGVPLPGRSHDAPLMPDEIAIFRGPINRVSRSRGDAVAQVRETVVHELGHYFGLDDDEMPH
jgi:predicted Zn-dependent protease with MMP-like domain